MDLALTRLSLLVSGIFSDLADEDGVSIAKCLEHSYHAGPMLYRPKIPAGIFVCKRGMHQLHGMSHPFETFEITEVPGHTNLLFHAGNFNRDSEGCILLGKTIIGEMVTDSRETFEKFMQLQSGFDSFLLTVS